MAREAAVLRRLLARVRRVAARSGRAIAARNGRAVAARNGRAVAARNGRAVAAPRVRAAGILLLAALPAMAAIPGIAALATFSGIAALATISGCSGRPTYEPGCYLNSAVKGATRRDLEAAAERFYGQLRSHAYEEAYAEASEALRTRVDKAQVAQAWTTISENLTIPQAIRTEEIAVAVFPPGTRGPQEISCIDPADAAGARSMLTTDQPYQAYLIQSADVIGTTFNFASVWYLEDNKWKLATFGVKARRQMGRDWTYYRDQARAELARGNVRNSALLYNLAMDLLVPAPWVKPAALDTLMKEQRRIHVDNLPAGRKLEWIARDGTVFNPYMVKYDIVNGAMILRIEYEVPTPIDTTQVAEKAPLLAEFIRTTFPEYQEIFPSVALDATTPLRHDPVWSGIFPLRQPASISRAAEDVRSR